MHADDVTQLALQVRVILEETMGIEEAAITRKGIVFRGEFRQPLEETCVRIRESLERLGLVAMISRRRGAYEVRVVPEAERRASNPLVNLVLFILTVGSTLLVGGQMSGVDIIARPDRFAAGIPFACSILSILAVHEFGHYLISAAHGVRASLPYFIPAPTIIGTFGAVIKTRSYIPDRKALLDIGAAGPICGFIVACVALGIGLSRAEIVDKAPLLQRGAWEFGDSLLVMIMTRLIKGPVAEGKAVMFTPIAFAGWVGLLITAFNLMPVGQLDGGHIVYALAGRWHAVAAKLVIAILLAMGFLWPGWWGWGLLVLLLGPSHAPPLDDVTPLNGGRKLVAFAALAIFALCFVPVPIAMTAAGG